MFNNSKRKYNAFTLVEALVAISILLTGIISGFILVTRSLYNVKLIQDRLTASFLAQEGIELVRKIRDSNYVKNINDGTSGPWNESLDYGIYYISFNPSLNKVNLQKAESETSVPNLNYDKDNNFYNYDSGVITDFKRIIRIEEYDQCNDNCFKVSSIVTWKTRNIYFEDKAGIRAEDYLYNWLSY